MAEETSLDDFFAKKDRSKKKQKQKIKYTDSTNATNTEENISGQNTFQTSHTAATANTKVSSTTQQKKEKPQSDVGSLTTPVEPEEEWIDFEEKTEKDYSGLRIQNIQITNRVESENESDQKDGGDEENSEEGGEKDDTNQGPWNKTNVATVKAPPEPEVIAPKPEDKSGKYIPPSVRLALANRNAPRKKKDAPDLKNEAEFPTLGTCPPPDSVTQPKTYEPPRPQGRRMEPTQQTVPLTLANRFAALS